MLDGTEGKPGQNADQRPRQQFMDLLDAHGGSLLAVLRRLCRNRHDADDVFQETAARVWRSLPAQPRLRNPWSWLMTIGYRAFLDARSRQSGRRRHEAIDDAERPITLTDARSVSPVQTAERAEVAERVRAATAELPDPVREVVELHYFGGLSLRETAAALGVAEGTVKSRLNAALGRLRGALEEP